MDQVIALYQKGLGGEKFKEIKTFRVTSSLAYQRVGIKGTVETIADGPDKFFTETRVPAFNLSNTSIVNGERGWMKDSAYGGFALAGESLELVRRDNPFVKRLDWRLHYQKIEVIGVEEVNGKETYAVRLTTSKTKPEVVYVAIDSGELLKRQHFVLSPVGPMQVTMYFEDYREVAGVRFPYRVTAENPVTGRLVQEVEKIEVNGAVPEATFTWQEPAKK